MTETSPFDVAMDGVVFCDVSYFQKPLDDDYPHPWVSFRACDGTFRDPAFAENYAWATRAAAAGKLVGYTVYAVFRPGVDVLAIVKEMVGDPDQYVTVMFDIESWRGAIRGDHSAAITKLASGAAAWLDNHRRVLAYGNTGDLETLCPNRPAWLRLVVADYSPQMPRVVGMVAWQYTDGSDNWLCPAGLPRSSPPFGDCDHNIFPGRSAHELPTLLGVGNPDPFTEQMELIMSWYKTKAEFEAAMTTIAEKAARAVEAKAPMQNFNEDSKGRRHTVETYLEGVPGYIPVEHRSSK